MTNVEALKNLYVALGGQRDEISELNTNPEVINAIAGLVGIKDTGVQPEKSTTDFWGTKVSAMQTGLSVADGSITGTLKYLSEGQLVTDWGAGNFMALKFIDNNDADSIKVGLVPSASGMPLQELDEDMNGAFKVTGLVDGVQQVFKVVTTKDGVEKTQVFDLTGLTLNNE